MAADKLAVSLIPVTLENWRETLSLAVLPEQQRFVSDHAPIAAIMLAKAYIRPGGHHHLPYAISHGDALVGMLQLVHDGPGAMACSLQHFFIDRRYQRRGFGTAALRAFIAHVVRALPACQVIRLTVHSENDPAQRLYTTFGFSSTGEIVDGEHVYALPLER